MPGPESLSVRRRRNFFSRRRNFGLQGILDAGPSQKGVTSAPGVSANYCLLKLHL